jgi:hypothetical protein
MKKLRPARSLQPKPSSLAAVDTDDSPALAATILRSARSSGRSEEGACSSRIAPIPSAPGRSSGRDDAPAGTARARASVPVEARMARRRVGKVLNLIESSFVALTNHLVLARASAGPPTAW